MAKGELGIVDRKPVPTLREFAENSFLPYVASTFASKPKTEGYYTYGAKSLTSFERLANERLDRITGELHGAYVASR